MKPFRTRFRRRLKVLSGSSLTIIPLVDVLFLLLIFFMMGSSLVFQPGITVNLPETIEEFIGVADKLVITITKEKLLFFNDQHVDGWEDLRFKLAAVTYGKGGGSGETYRRRTRTPIIILKADRDVAYDDIVRVMSITREFKMSTFLATKTVSR
jgi:biopolymer transport protein ExbD